MLKKSKERLFEEVRFKVIFGCVKIEAQILSRSLLLSRYNTAIKLGFEAECHRAGRFLFLFGAVPNQFRKEKWETPLVGAVP